MQCYIGFVIANQFELRLASVHTILLLCAHAHATYSHCFDQSRYAARTRDLLTPNGRNAAPRNTCGDIMGTSERIIGKTCENTRIMGTSERIIGKTGENTRTE